MRLSSRSLWAWTTLYHVSSPVADGFVFSVSHRRRVATPVRSTDADENEPTSSAAEEWAREQRRAETEPTDETEPTTPTTRRKKYVVVGGGWGGWGAAKTLCQSGVDAEVTLIDALPDPTGETPYVSRTGKPVEAGTRGFWKDYPNINALCAELGLDENDVFTPFTNSSFYSPDGLEATAPVFAEAKLPPLPFLPKELNERLADAAFPTLPSPLGQVLATFPLFERLPLADRASMVGLLVATVDALGAEDEAVREAYDRTTAHELFVRFGLSKRLVDDFVRPTLLVGLFKPPEELSALVVMELLYYYALAHQDSFDVRWIKRGTVADSLTAPLARALIDDRGLTVRGACRVGTIALSEGSPSSARSVSYHDAATRETRTIDDVDGVVLALGNKGLRSVVGASPDLARLPVFSAAASLGGVDVVSARLWFDRAVPTRTPANVFARFATLRGAGGTFFMLDQLQADDADALWGDEEPQGSVVACDFYNAGGLITMTDEDLVKLLTEDLLPSAVPRFADAAVVDSWVGRYPGAVSWFSPGSYSRRPPTEGAGRDVLPNVKCAGDWVRMGDREHGAKGLCQERAYVSGIEAANALLRDDASPSSYVPGEVLPVRDDETQFRAAVALNRRVATVLPRFWTR